MVILCKLIGWKLYPYNLNSKTASIRFYTTIQLTMYWNFCFHGTKAPSVTWPPHYRGFTITIRHTAVGRTPLDEWSARRRDLFLTTHNTHNRDTSMPPAGFEPTISAAERPQTYALDRAANWDRHTHTHTHTYIYIYKIWTAYMITETYVSRTLKFMSQFWQGCP